MRISGAKSIHICVGCVMIHVIALICDWCGLQRSYLPIKSIDHVMIMFDFTEIRIYTRCVLSSWWWAVTLFKTHIKTYLIFKVVTVSVK